MKTLRYVIIACAGFFACKNDVVSPPTTQQITATTRLIAVNSFASSFGTQLQLIKAHAVNVTIDGRSDSWCYDYLDSSSLPPVVHCFHATINQVGFDSTSLFPPGASIITHNWFDSDSALYFAEQNSGSEFRNQYPRCEIQASLREDVSESPITSWWVVYRADKTHALMLEINATTGELVTKLESNPTGTFGSAG